MWNDLILKIYDRFRRSPFTAWTLFAVLTVLMLCSVFTLRYSENISDFLPMDEKNQAAFSVYQDISGANRIYAIVCARDTANAHPQQLVDGVDAFVAKLEEADSLHCFKDIMAEIDMDQMMEVSESVYSNIPYFLTDADYARMDSLLATPGYVDRQLDEDRQLLLFPSSNILSGNISRDPLNLFTPILGRLKQAGVAIDFDTYDGHILTPDGKRAVVIMESAFGGQETENNGALVQLLEQAKHDTELENAGVDIHLIGGPTIAVANAKRIKDDSILAGCIAGILIIALLIYVFRNIRNILLIVVSVAWGWLFAMAAIALYYNSVSIIVIGIASVILGIAVNYPLHLIDHLSESSHPRASLREIISPLVVGNITTVGAFLCLVPLNSPALHDLGLFSSLLLVGTILFVLIMLPHMVRTRRATTHSEPRLISRLADINLENKPWVVLSVLILTAVFAFFSMDTEFDSDMRNINYMTPQQKADMSYFQSLAMPGKNTESLYVVSTAPTWDEALSQNQNITPTIDSIVQQGYATRPSHVASFLVSKAQQQARLDRWNSFVEQHRELLSTQLASAATAHGFSQDAFGDFSEIISAQYAVVDFEHFQDFIGTVFRGSMSEDSKTGKKSIIQELAVQPHHMDRAKEQLAANKEFGGFFFDVKSMNGSIANTLSNDFNYIGIACGFIVFAFLWLSLGRIELAIVSFIPMAVSWIWILGIMALLGIKFNIVNIILATFIFGQGDDYTIFITEGLCYEYAYRKKLLAAYKNSIVVSALIMFIGIGTLMLAQHPAMRSLGQVTVVGMISVVLMAYLFPPLIFKYLTQKNGKLRFTPLTLGCILSAVRNAIVIAAQCTAVYIIRHMSKNTACRLIHRMAKFDLKLLRTQVEYINADGIQGPCLIACNYSNSRDIACILALSPSIRLAENGTAKVNKLIYKLLKRSGVLISAPAESTISAHIYRSTQMGSLSPILVSFTTADEEAQQTFSTMLASVTLMAPIVYRKYIYKGRDIAIQARKALQQCTRAKAQLEARHKAHTFTVLGDQSQGELALLLGLMYPQASIYCYLESPDARTVLRAALHNFVTNVHVLDTPEFPSSEPLTTVHFNIDHNYSIAII